MGDVGELDATVRHVSAMLALAKKKHNDAISMLGNPDQDAIQRLHEVLKLLEEVEILADDCGSYVDSPDMKAAIKELHYQQASVELAIGRLEELRSTSPCSKLWPWLGMVLIALMLIQMF